MQLGAAAGGARIGCEHAQETRRLAGQPAVRRATARALTLSRRGRAAASSPAQQVGNSTAVMAEQQKYETAALSCWKQRQPAAKAHQQVAPPAGATGHSSLITCTVFRLKLRPPSASARCSSITSSVPLRLVSILENLPCGKEGGGCACWWHASGGGSSGGSSGGAVMPVMTALFVPQVSYAVRLP